MAIAAGIVQATNSSLNATPQMDAGVQSGENFANVPLAFFGGTAVAQPSGSTQAALGRANAGGAIFTYSTSQSPSSVANNTTAEQGFTVQSGTVTNCQNLLTTGDLLYINKPSAQAGLGMGNVRVSASNVAGVTFSNFTAATITPGSSQSYTIVALRGVPTTAVTLSPAAVAPNSTVEQVFTLTSPSHSFVTGQLVQVMKPTAQAGLDIVGCRVAGNNQVGITFTNVTAATITPTAAESYTIYSLAGLDAVNNFMGFQMNAGTIGAIGAGVVITGGATTMTGALATDIAIGPPTPPSAQAAATNAAIPAYSILTADTMTMYFFGVGAGFTPTASLPYNQLVFRQNPAAPLKLYTQTLTPTSVAANTTAEQTFTVTGLVSGSAVWVNKPSATVGLGIAGVRVSATSTLAINFTNSSAAVITPPAEAYIIGNFQVKAPGNGNCVYQAVSPVSDGTSDLVNALRSAIGPTGVNLIAGA